MKAHYITMGTTLHNVYHMHIWRYFSSNPNSHFEVLLLELVGLGLEVAEIIMTSGLEKAKSFSRFVEFL